MQKYNFIFSLLLTGAIIFGAAACEERLEKYPRASMASEMAMADIEGIEGTLWGLYNRMQAGGYNHAEMNLAGGLLTDQLKVAAANSGRYITYPTNRELASTFSFSRANWPAIYNDINRINMMLYYIDDVEATEARIDMVKGQALAMRGYLYFDLMKIWARPYMYQSPLVQGEPLGVIIKTSPFLGLDEDSFASRSTIEECYQQILDDFETALTLLPADNQDFPHFFTNLSVKALLARLHLFMGNWQEAADYAEEVMNHTLANLTDAGNYMDAFANSPGAESIFELGYTSADRPGMNTSVQGLAWTDGEGIGYGDVILRQDLIDLLDFYRTKGDVRPEMTFEFNKEGEDVVYQNKFAGYRGEIYWDDIRVIRTAEMYLIAAEAYAELDRLDDARDILTEFREHRMDTEHAEVTLATKDELIDLILTERRVEFFSEMSHRWFDLRRRGMDIPKGCPDNDPGIPLSFDDYRMVGRIPNAEVEANENAIQNPGY